MSRQLQVGMQHYNGARDSNLKPYVNTISQALRDLYCCSLLVFILDFTMALGWGKSENKVMFELRGGHTLSVTAPVP